MKKMDPIGSKDLGKMNDQNDLRTIKEMGSIRLKIKKKIGSKSFKMVKCRAGSGLVSPMRGRL